MAMPTAAGRFTREDPGDNFPAVMQAGPPREETEIRPPVKQYRRSRDLIVGVILLVVGSGPLVSGMIAGKLGLVDDPSPNSRVLGTVAWLTFWPAILLIVVGVLQVQRERRRVRDDAAASLP